MAPSTFKCTVGFCQRKLPKELLTRHPILKVTVCDKCKKFYGRGDFENRSKYPDGVDEKGFDNICRWCGDGGNIISCSLETCRHGFCESCINKNFDPHFRVIAKGPGWKCFVCNPKQIQKLRKEADDLFGERRSHESSRSAILGNRAERSVYL